MSGMLLSGETKDYESRVGRGRLEFFTSSMRIGKQGMTGYTKNTTSKFTGMELSMSGKYSGKNIDLGFSVTPPVTITRKYTMTGSMDSVASTRLNLARFDSVHIVTPLSASGQDKMLLPWRGTFAMALHIRKNFVIGIDYEVRSYMQAKYTDATGSEVNPWLTSSIVHGGAEYRPESWLALRAGVTSMSEVFEPLSNPIRGDAVKYPVYSLGCGVEYAGATLNITYEYSAMEYIDTWSNAASITKETNSNIIASISYLLPWFH